MKLIVLIAVSTLLVLTQAVPYEKAVLQALLKLQNQQSAAREQHVANTEGRHGSNAVEQWPPYAQKQQFEQQFIYDQEDAKKEYYIYENEEANKEQFDMEKINVAQLQELLSMLVAEQGHHDSQSETMTQAFSARRSYMTSEKAVAQWKGVNIQSCGFAGNLIDSILKAALAPLHDHFGVWIACPDASYPCTTVQVDVPGDNKLVDVDVCRYNGGTCVKVYVETKTGCSGIPIPVVVPVVQNPGFFGQSVTVFVTVGKDCAKVDVSAPSCPSNILQILG